MKKQPVKVFERESGLKPFIGTMADDSRGRRTSYLKTGCNSFNSNRPKSLPLSFWNEKDIWNYIKKYNLDYSSLYNMGYERSGCVFCLFGVHLEGQPNRFQRMQKTHPKLHNYCINKLKCGEVLDYIGVPYTDETLLF